MHLVHAHTQMHPTRGGFRWGAHMSSSTKKPASALLSERVYVMPKHVNCLFMYLLVCVPVCGCVSHVQYSLLEYLARGAVCCLNKGSQLVALKRTFIKRFHSLHLFLWLLQTSCEGATSLSALPPKGFLRGPCTYCS